MIYIILFFSAAIIIFGSYALFSLRTDGWRRWAGPGLLGVTAITAVILFTQILGKPIPVWAEVGIRGKVIFFSLDEPNYVYIWVLPEGSLEPVAITLPWDVLTANEVHKMIKKGIPIEFDQDHEIPIHPMPVKPLPLKEES